MQDQVRQILYAVCSSCILGVIHFCGHSCCLQIILLFLVCVCLCVANPHTSLRTDIDAAPCAHTAEAIDAATRARCSPAGQTRQPREPKEQECIPRSITNASMFFAHFEAFESVYTVQLHPWLPIRNPDRILSWELCSKSFLFIASTQREFQ